MPSEPVLKLDGVSLGTGVAGVAERVVRDLSLEIKLGEAIGLVGESGSGKSMTAMSIAGMLPAGIRLLSGQISLENRVISNLPEASLHKMRGKEISYVFQDPLSALNPTLTIGTQLLDVLKRHGVGGNQSSASRVITALASVGIKQPEDRIKSYPHELSGGMRQRVLIAMAMLCGPKLLIADEPTTALDVTVQARIVDLFRQIRATGVSILFISHNLDLVLGFCDRVAVMYGGRLVEEGTARAIAEFQHHPYTRALLECVPRLGIRGRELKVIEGKPPVDLGRISGCAFAERCTRAQPRCRSEAPPLKSLARDHQYACWNPLLPNGERENATSSAV